MIGYKNKQAFVSIWLNETRCSLEYLSAVYHHININKTPPTIHHQRTGTGVMRNDLTPVTLTSPLRLNYLDFEKYLNKGSFKTFSVEEKILITVISPCLTVSYPLKENFSGHINFLRTNGFNMDSSKSFTPGKELKVIPQTAKELKKLLIYILSSW